MKKGAVDDEAEEEEDSTVSVVIPVLNEEVSLPILLDFLATKCTPRPHEIIVSDGGSTDGTLAIARSFQHEQQQQQTQKDKKHGIQVVVLSPPSSDDSLSPADMDITSSSSSSAAAARRPCRAFSQNRGLQAATCQLVIFIHADTLPPRDFVVLMHDMMKNNNKNKKDRVSLSAFRAIIVNDHNQQVNSFITFHHFIKTYYGPLLLYPYQTIFRGLLCFFGDQCMFGRRRDLLAVGGFDPVPVLEEFGLCKKMSLTFGPCQMCQPFQKACITSDRRIALYGTFKVTLLHLFLAFGFELMGDSSLEYLSHYYPPQHVLEEQCRMDQIVHKNMRFNHWAERQFLWKEIVQDRCYDHAQLSFHLANVNNVKELESSSSITIVDVGANVGLFSLWMANSSKLQAAAAARNSRSSNSTASSVTIHALEPSPHTFQLLKSNVSKVQEAASVAQQQQQQKPSRNTDIRIVPHQLAISSSTALQGDQEASEQELTFTTYPRCTGWSTFHRDEESLYHDLHSYLAQRVLSLFGSTLGNLINGTLLKLIYPVAFRLLTSGASTSTVPVTNLSSFIREHDIQSIDLLKIDVERHEYQVLLGIRDADWSKIQAIAMEAEVHQSDILQLLRERGGFDIVEEIKDPFMEKTPHSMIWALRTRHESK